MADYKRMYCLLCRAADAVIDPLMHIPEALPFAEYLQDALLTAENIYIETGASDIK